MTNSPQRLTDYQMEERNRRTLVVEETYRLRERGHSQNQIAEMLGVPPASLSRYLSAFESGGEEALTPKTRECGRPPLARLTPEEQVQVQGLVVKMATNTKTGRAARRSRAKALRLFAQTDACREETREVILKDRKSIYTITPTLMRQSKVTAEVLMQERGPKNSKLNAYSQPQELTYINARGEKVPLTAGDVETWDDMHFNSIFCVPCDAETDPCARRYGVRVCRAQGIFSLDMAAARLTSAGIVARYNDAYNHRDILWQMERKLRSIGKPRAGMKLEKGAWDANVLMDALSRCGIKVRHADSAKGKAILEERFDVLQKMCAVTGFNLGRKRGEYEWENKLWLDLRAGKLDPLGEGCIMVGPFLEKVANAVNLTNSEPMEGELYRGVPDELWNMQMKGRDLVKLNAAELWFMQPQQHHVSIQGGHARCKVEEFKCSFYFHAPWFADLGRGYKVIVSFDPAAPQAGAAILNREVGIRAHERDVVSGENQEKPYLPGELIGLAEYVERVPMFSVMDGYDDGVSFHRRAEFIKHCRMLYREIMPFGRGTPARADEKRDGRGNVERIELSRSGAGTVNAEAMPGQCRASEAVERTTRQAPVPARKILDAQEHWREMMSH